MHKLQVQVQYLQRENAVQHKVISQLVKLVSSRQSSTAKPNLQCGMGHSSCRINHTKFNYVKKVENDLEKSDSGLFRSFKGLYHSDTITSLRVV